MISKGNLMQATKIDPLIQRINQMLGFCVLIPCSGKKPLKAGWRKLSISDMRNDHYSTLKGHNIGVVLGEQSVGLCSLDIDSDEGVELMLQRNPILANTLQTRGRRGRNFWFRITDCEPGVMKLTFNGSPWGEFRGTGGQTIIHGTHPDTQRPYEIVNEARPLSLALRSLIWPAGVENDDLAEIMGGERDPVYASPTQGDAEGDAEAPRCRHSSASLCISGMPSASQATSINQASEEDRERIAKLFERYVAKKFGHSAGTRNSFITNAVPFLYRAVCPALVRSFSAQFYREGRGVFNDPEDQHARETVAMIEAVERTYLAELSPLEKGLHTRLSPDRQAALRICRALARATNRPTEPPPLFFLAVGDLAARLCLSNMTAYRILRDFCDLKVLSVEIPGQRRAAGVTGMATVYKYLLS